MLSVLSLAASRSSLLFFSFPLGNGRQEWSSAFGHGEYAQLRGAPAPPPLPAEASPRLGGFSFLRSSPPPPSGFPRHDPRLWQSCLLESLVRQEPRSVLIRMGSAEFRLRQAPSPL